MTSFLITFGLGAVTGWLLFSRPQWVADLFTWARGKLGW